MLELDVFLSKDKKIVISHDEELKRTCGCEGVISDFNYEVSQLVFLAVLKTYCDF